MKYIKPALSFGDQTSLLISRGLIVADPHELETYLQHVNYYRLSGYWYIFKQNNPITGEEEFKPGTTFQMIRERYEFDRNLRLLLMDAIERIEVSILRTRMVEVFTAKYGPFGYADIKNYNPKFSQQDFNLLMSNISKDEKRSYEEFIQRYRYKYYSEINLPFWMVTELMTYGQLLTIFRNLDFLLKKSIAFQFNLKAMVLDSWLLTLNYVRNSCAHHARLWNRPLPLPVKFPDYKHDSSWYLPNPIANNTIFSILSIVQYLLKIIYPTNKWKLSIEQLTTSYPKVPLKPMGFPLNWKDTPLWK